MEDMISWMVFGGGLGFWRAWRKTSESAKRARNTIDSIAGIDAKTKAEAIGYNKGLRSVALAVSTIIGVIFGLSIWGIASLLVYLTG